MGPANTTSKGEGSLGRQRAPFARVRGLGAKAAKHTCTGQVSKGPRWHVHGKVRVGGAQGATSPFGLWPTQGVAVGQPGTVASAAGCMAKGVAVGPIAAQGVERLLHHMGQRRRGSNKVHKAGRPWGKGGGWVGVVVGCTTGANPYGMVGYAVGPACKARNSSMVGGWQQGGANLVTPPRSGCSLGVLQHGWLLCVPSPWAGGVA